jgi:glycosyltransferase involved in cell wall biosynthesis
MVTPFFSPNIGGVETYLDDLCDYLRKRGHRIFVMTYQPLTTKVKAPKFERERNLEVRRIEWLGYNLFHRLEPYPLLEFIYLTPILCVYSLSFLLRHRNEVDVIHAHGLNAAFVAGVLAKLCKKKTVVSFHTIYRFKKRKTLAYLLRAVLPNFDKVLVLSHSAELDVVALGGATKKIHIARYWVNQSLFKPMNKALCKKQLSIDGSVVLLFVGRLIESKGVRILLDAAKTMREMLFVFVGEGPLEEQIKSYGKLYPNIRFLGKKCNKELPIIYNCADILWGNPDRDYIGRVAIEALSCGVPLIAPNEVSLFDIPEKVLQEAIPPYIGVLVKPRADAVVKELKSLNSTKLLKLSANCRKFALQNFSEENARIIEKTYTETMK